MGLSLFKSAAEQCSGTFNITSEPGLGTKVAVTMQYAHLDRQPLGDIAGTIALLASSNPYTDFIYNHITNSGEYTFNTKEIKTELQDVSITNPKVIKFIREMIQENIKEINHL